MEGDSLKLNFEIALEKIDTLSKHNIDLLNKINELEKRLNKPTMEINSSTAEGRFKKVTEGADEAMERYKHFLRKEFPHAKSKQSKGQSV